MCNDAYIDDMMDIPYGEGEGIAYGELLENAYNGPEHPDQEEANFWFTISDFQELVKNYGVKTVIDKLDPEISQLLFWYFSNVDNFTIRENESEFVWKKCPVKLRQQEIQGLYARWVKDYREEDNPF